MTKRLFDLFVAATGLLILAPFMTVIAIWIRCDSGGPALFRQQRVGREGHLFSIFKFRTMQHQLPDGPQLTVSGDARITRAGHVLRKYKIDELPQLINVLQGTMSLVGPRPEVARYVALYPAAVRREVLSVAPGITDWASIAYRQENSILALARDPEQAYVEEVMPAKLAFCQRYVRERNFWIDLRIIFGTIAALLHMR